MNQSEVEAAIIEIIERAEYAGRLKGAAIKTRSNREATANHEASDISSRMARVMAHELAVKVAAK
jgi:hypothetical protein